MFGHRFFGARYFGPRYWGPGVSAPVPPDIPMGGAGHPAGIWWGEKHHKKFKKNLDWILDRVVSEYYGELTKPDVPKAVQKKAAALVKPYAKDGKKIPEAVNWEALQLDIVRVKKILELWQIQYQLEAEEEEWMMLH